MLKWFLWAGKITGFEKAAGIITDCKSAESGKPFGNTPLVNPVLKKVNPTILTFHGLGHILNANSPQNKVLEFENLAIKAYNHINGTKLNKSKPDETHNKYTQ
jgi:hypothetical protein